MAYLQTIGEVPNGGAFARLAAETFGGEQELMVLRFDFAETCGQFTEVKEPADMVPEIG